MKTWEEMNKEYKNMISREAVCLIKKLIKSKSYIASSINLFPEWNPHRFRHVDGLHSNGKFQILLDLAMAVLLLTSCVSQPTTEIRNDFKKYYDQYQVTGAMVIFDEKNDNYICYNEPMANQAFIPASTFKICNSLIGLETGVISDENFVIEWDSITRQVEAWNKDQDMKSAFKNSTVWYYQELARRVGHTKMKYWLDQAQYGNSDTTGGIDMFWLTGGLRVTPMQQIDFLKRLHDEKLPFSKRSIGIVKKIMIRDSTEMYILRGKTGWGIQNGLNIGWFVGYIETAEGVYYFANCIQTTDDHLNKFQEARIDIVYKVLQALRIIRAY